MLLDSSAQLRLVRHQLQEFRHLKVRLRESQPDCHHLAAHHLLLWASLRRRWGIPRHQLDYHRRLRKGNHRNPQQVD